MPAVFSRLFHRLSVLILSCAASSAAVACPAGETEICLGTCFCAPVAKEEIGPIYEDVSQMAATGLEGWLVESRNSAAAGDIRPIPLNIRVQLEPYYDMQVLESVRYKVGDEGELNAANAVLQNPDVNAVTLIDIIVFRNQDDALNDVALWAHELKHVEQYQQWGVGEFAKRYTRDFNAVEAPGYEMQRRVARELKSGAGPK